MKTIFKLLGSGGGFDTQATQPKPDRRKRSQGLLLPPERIKPNSLLLTKYYIPIWLNVNNFCYLIYPSYLGIIFRISTMSFSDTSEYWEMNYESTYNDFNW